MSVRTIVRGGALALLVVLGFGGCAAPRQLSRFQGTPLAGHPRVAVLPLENLSGTLDAGRSLTQVFVAELVSAGICDVVETGNVESAVRALRVRDTNAPTTDQVRALGDTLGARFLLCGVVLEHGDLETPDGKIPAIGVAMKLLEVPTARVAWAKVLVRTGDDRESLFGWGRVPDASRVGAALAAEIIRDLRRLTGETARPASRSDR